MKPFIQNILLALWLCLGLGFALVLDTQPRQPSDVLDPGRPGTLLSQRAASPPALAFSNATLTSKWFEGTNMVQIIEVIVENTDSTNWLGSGDNFHVTVDSSSVTFVQAGTVRRLRPGDKTWLQIGVKNKAGVSPGSSCSVKIAATWGPSSGQRNTSATVTGLCGVGNYTATKDSLLLHQSPDWFDNAKYGIFFHWGLYSAPAYGYIQPNESYAEWYWNHQQSSTEKTRTYQYHLETYGKSFNYDDFISNFTASKFDPKSWLDLIDNAGAQYFVPVTKHHDGFALFNFSESISKRSTVHYGPKRDFIGELLSTAKSSYPHLRRGTYFSLPEWYNPAYAKYAKLPSFPGGPPKNPYTNEVIDYTGYVDVDDFVTDIQLPQMKALAYDYDTEIMWCDIGGANNSTILLSDWLNWARNNGRQVTFNSRCGVKGDYDTPEYKTVANAAARKWEATRGMDPFSFGYNYMTPDDQYFTGYNIVQTLVDIVSKNGNFLLDVGPKNDGTIAEIMVTNLVDAGKWIKAHSESLFSTRYWLTTSGTGNLRYTTTDDAFYIHVLSTPNGTVAIPDPIPYLHGDSVTVVGGSKAGHVVPMTANTDGSYTLTVDKAVASADKYVWTFKITY